MFNFKYFYHYLKLQPEKAVIALLTVDFSGVPTSHKS